MGEPTVTEGLWRRACRKCLGAHKRPARGVSIAWMSEESHIRVKDGVTWRIGTQREVEWIRAGTIPGLSIGSGVPLVFADYATLVQPGEPDVVRDGEAEAAHDRALLAVLQKHTATQPWWLAYLDTGASDIVFTDAPKVTLYSGWSYVLVQAGPEQAASWRPAAQRNWKSSELPEVMFPTDRSWMVSTLWDDDWACIGGSTDLIADLLADGVLGPRMRRVNLVDDATPPGHAAR